MDVRIIVDKTSIEIFYNNGNSNDRNIFPDKPMEYFSVSKAETKYTMENVLLINLILTKLSKHKIIPYLT
jgi:levanase/fructan beta-fructosidase